MPEPTIIEASRAELPFPEFLAPGIDVFAPCAGAGLAIQQHSPGSTPLPPVLRRPQASQDASKRLAVVVIGDTFIEILEAPSGSACNNCPFAMHDPMPHNPPVCCIPDYLACRPHLRFRIAETAKGVPS